jgi:hypothetical protein
VDVYQVFTNKIPGVKIGPAPGVIDFPYMYVVKNLNNLFCENQKALELLYLA